MMHHWTVLNQFVSIDWAIPRVVNSHLEGLEADAELHGGTVIHLPRLDASQHSDRVLHFTISGKDPLLSNTDVGKTIQVKDGKVRINSSLQSVKWRSRLHADGTATIKDLKFPGDVTLEDGTKFDNGEGETLEKIARSLGMTRDQLMQECGSRLARKCPCTLMCSSLVIAWSKLEHCAVTGPSGLCLASGPSSVEEHSLDSPDGPVQAPSWHSALHQQACQRS